MHENNNDFKATNQNDNPCLINEDDELILAEEDDDSSLANEEGKQQSAWKVMIVDNEIDIHQVIQLLLEKLVFQDKPLTIFSAYSSEQAKSLLKTHPDTALLFLDVVMEDEHSGLQLVKYIRNTLQNPLVRIILHTGFDEIPEEFVINDYDISDYKLKTEMTKRKLFMTTRAGLKAYSDLITLQANQVAMEQLNVQLQKEITKRQHATQKLVKINQAYEKFVPCEFLNLLGKQSIVDINLGDQVEKEMTILFADIRSFTSLSETLTPQDSFEFLNSYLGQMEPIIIAHNGFIDKYIGDAIMALFICANDAMNASIAMLKRLAEYNQLLETAGFEPLKIGIGINTGPLMLGILGGQERMESTVIADAVNISARVESLTKTYDSLLLITENTYQKLEEISQYCIRIMDWVTVKGKTKPITVYEVFDAEPSAIIELKLTTLRDFEQGFQCFHHEQFEQAQSFFEKILQINNNDKAAQVYLEHCQKVLGMKMPKRPKILIVDDVHFNLKVLSALLRSSQFEVSVAEDGEIALEIVEFNPPHLILLDVMMPNVDGFETCRRLKANIKTQDIPVIFITALSETVNKVKGFELGAVDYITKPFQREEVLSRVKTHLKLHHLQKQLQSRNVELEINNLQLKDRLKTLTM